MCRVVLSSVGSYRWRLLSQTLKLPFCYVQSALSNCPSDYHSLIIFGIKDVSSLLSYILHHYKGQSIHTTSEASQPLVESLIVGFRGLSVKWHNRRIIVASVAPLIPLLGTALVYALPKSMTAVQMFGLYLMNLYWRKFVYRVSLPAYADFSQLLMLCLFPCRKQTPVARLRRLLFSPLSILAMPQG
jgi:hypothetical protein